MWAKKSGGGRGSRKARLRPDLNSARAQLVDLRAIIQLTGCLWCQTALASEFPCKIKPMRAVEQRKPVFGTTNRAGFHFLPYLQALAVSHCLSRAKGFRRLKAKKHLPA